MGSSSRSADARPGARLSGNYTISHCTTDSPVRRTLRQRLRVHQSRRSDLRQGQLPVQPHAHRRVHVGLPDAAVRQHGFASRGVGLARFRRGSNGQSGNWLTVTTGVDPAGTGIGGQRVNQVSDDVYGPKTKQPDAIVGSSTGQRSPSRSRGPTGTMRRAASPGQASGTSISPSPAPSSGRPADIRDRVETFNLFNNFNWGDPVTNLDSHSSGELRLRTAVRVSCSSLKNTASDGDAAHE